MKAVFVLFVGVALLQLAVPASMILRREQVLREGRVVRFRTAPVDPYDAFRGRYVALRYEQDTVPAQTGAQELSRGMPIYVQLEEGEEGFSRPVSYARTRPDAGVYMRVRVQWVHWNDREIHIEYPFDRYYMNEREAPRAERAVQQLSRGNPQPTYVTVRLKDGMAVLEDLFLDGKSVDAFLQEEQMQP